MITATSDVRLDFAGILRDQLGACSDRAMVTELAGLDASWTERFDLSDDFNQWFMGTFLSRGEARRAVRAMAEIRKTCADLRLPLGVAREIELRVRNAMYPNNYEIVMGATSHPASRVAASMKRLGLTEERWRTRF